MSGADKQDLRSELLQGRRTLTPARIVRARRAVRDAVLAEADRAGWGTIAAYLPLRTEPGSPELLRGLRDRGMQVLVPETLPDRDLTWVDWPTTLARGPDGIALADCVLVPALAVASSDGTRLGRGGGSYDRALRRCAPGAPIVALLHDGEVVHRLPSEAWDVPVTGYVTPADGWRSLSGDAPA